MSRNPHFSFPLLNVFQIGVLFSDLVGEGQEIYSGEEAGFSQWAKAVNSGKQNNWVVHCPQHLLNVFESQNVKCIIEPLLNLTVSLRSHFAEDLHNGLRFLE